MASLSKSGQVEVWRLKGMDAKYEWSLNFNSVTKIEANTTIENQFFVRMSSEDVSTSSKQDSILLFQFSRPQNLIKFWKFKTEVTHMRFMDTDPSVLLVINKNQEMQRIYCCDTIVQLQCQSRSKVKNAEAKSQQLDQQDKDTVRVDYKFTQNAQRLESAVSKRSKADKALAPILQSQETQIRRLDEADRQAGFGGITEFATQPELAFCFEQFSDQMLVQKSTATTLIDLQAEMNDLKISGGEDTDAGKNSGQQKAIASNELLSIDSFFKM